MQNAKAESFNRGPGRPKADTPGPTARERILHAATDLFCRYGINAIGIDAVIHEAGTAKTTLYKIYGSKEVLVREVLVQQGKEWRRNLFTALDKKRSTPEKKLLAIFDILKEWFSGPDYYGCPFINAVGEHDKLEDTIRKVTIQHKKKVLERIKILAEESGIKKSDDFAHEFGIIIDGAIVAALITRDPNIAKIAQRTAKAILMRELPN